MPMGCVSRNYTERMREIAFSLGEMKTNCGDNDRRTFDQIISNREIQRMPRAIDTY